MLREQLAKLEQTAELENRKVILSLLVKLFPRPVTVAGKIK